LESLRHEKEEGRLRIERLEKELNFSRNTLKTLEEEKYDVNRTINTLKA
jgi:cytoskeletal protein RodZ